MKINHLRSALTLLIAGQLFFSCNTAKQYQFLSKTESYRSEISGEKKQQEISTEIAASSMVSEAVTHQVPENFSASISSDITLIETEPILKSAEKTVSFSKPERLQTGTTQFEVSAKDFNRKALRNSLKELKKINTKDTAGSAQPTLDVVEVILAILLPPLAVYLHEGSINDRFWISLILTLLGFLPGVIYALLVVSDTI